MSNKRKITRIEELINRQKELVKRQEILINFTEKFIDKLAKKENPEKIQKRTEKFLKSTFSTFFPCQETDEKKEAKTRTYKYP